MKNKLIKLIVLGITITIFANCDNNSKVIPIDISTGRPTISVKINDSSPYTFIFDTGSGGNVIDSELAKQLELEVVGENELRTPGSDKVIKADIVNSKKVKVDGINLEIASDFTTANLRRVLPIDGIIGGSTFADYLLTIDYKNKELVLVKDKLDPNDKDVTKYSNDFGVINVIAEVDGEKYDAHLDSGNPGYIDLPYSLKEKLVFTDGPHEAGVIRTPVDEFKKWEGQIEGVVSLGDIKYFNPKVQLVENFQFINFGFHIFNDLKIIIDQSQKLIKFEKH